MISNLADIIDIFTKEGYEVTAYPTQEPGDATQKTMERAGSFDLVVCSGGDGTLDEVVTGMMKCRKKVPIGYIPAGSTNDFASSIKIPADMKQAADIAVHGRIVNFDMGSFNNDTFVYVAAFGMFTDVSYGTDQAIKNVFGHLAYLFEGIKHLSDIKPYRIKIEYDGGVIEDNFIYGMVSNSLSVAGMKNFVGNDVLLDDGLFEATFVRPAREVAAYNIEVANSIRTGKKNALILNFKTKSMRITSDEEISWTLDGEYGGSFKEVELSNLKRAVKIVVPNGVKLPFAQEKKAVAKKQTPPELPGAI
ncbi:MAG: YegS/Rv2252/BmrU family lipid kinase [Lachnospiraceae bacterium]|nr:YegS/Rv2252/BmrU family lipid kinase [Lachnospiraceae bacterium]